MRQEKQKQILEDILPLTPLQQGFLFHALYDSQGLDVYNGQIVLGLEGALDEEVLEAAAVAMLRRQANLRAAFRHEGLSQPVQVIPSEVVVPWERIDLSDLEEEEKDQYLTQWLAADRERRFDLISPPLLRWALIALGKDRYRLVLTNHHLLLDGWSMPVLLEELLSLYQRKGAVDGLPRVRPYRDYLEWLAAQDSASAREAWKAELEGPAVLQ
jgi:hypothetical protein